MLKVFIGFDSREPIAYHVLAHSILTRASRPVAIVPLVQDQLRRWGPYTRERGMLETTEFSLTRFLVPWLSNYQGLSIFLDCDMVCLTDLTKAADLLGDHAVAVCQHDYTPTSTRKFLDQSQSTYPRKNWSSFMVFNNARCQALTPAYVNTVTGLMLHRFWWMPDDTQIGSLPLEWNYLVGEPGQSQAPPKLVHFTNGGPWFPETADGEYADRWRAELQAMQTCREGVLA